MSHFHNGKPLWCRPAPTKSVAIWTPEDEDEETVALSELPGLIAKAIKAGLVQKPKTESVLISTVSPWRRANCTACGIRFVRNKKAHVKCADCRMPFRNCVQCGKKFQTRQHKATCCSLECSKKKQIESFRKNYVRKPVPLVQCIICKEHKPMRQAGSTFAKTCGKECASVYRKQRATDSNQTKAKERRENKA